MENRVGRNQLHPHTTLNSFLSPFTTSRFRFNARSQSAL